MKNLRFLFAVAVPVIALSLGANAMRAGALDDKPQAKSADGKPAKTTDEAKPKGAELDKAAPDFTLKDVDGKTVKLSDFKGKTVVLEWFNPECPVSAGCHQKGALKDQAERVAKDGIVWLSINSSAAGKEGSGAEKNKKAAGEWKMKNPVLLDESGEVGHLYGARTTPHMFVIDAKGILVYRGAIDNAMAKKGEDEKPINYVDNVLADLKAGKAVATKETKSYGCGVKYGNPNPN
jgi:peroxiredoxin